MQSAIVCLLLSACTAQEIPASVNCSIGRTDPQRPERWQFYLTKIFPDGKTQRVWISDHDSASAAMKSCAKELKNQDKFWKSKTSKGKTK